MHIITIDGPSGVGKGTISTRLARHLNFSYLDSGALYRLIAYSAQRGGFGDDELDRILAHFSTSHIEFGWKESGDGVAVCVDGVDVSEHLRNEQIASLASKCAILPEVRSFLLEWQRSYGAAHHLVADGRDMGTVVFPHADVKFFLDASVEVRAQRRFKQLKEKGLNVNLSEIEKELTERDERDRNRQTAPLKPASDAVMIDTSHLSIEAVLEEVLRHIPVFFC